MPYPKSCASGAAIIPSPKVFQAFCAPYKMPPNRLPPRASSARCEQAMQVKKDCGVLLPEEEATERLFSRRVHALTDGAADLSALAEEDTARRASQSASGALLTSHLENAMQFLQETFGPGHELLVFLTQLSALPDAKRFLRESAIYTALLQQTSPEELAKHL